MRSRTACYLMALIGAALPASAAAADPAAPALLPQTPTSSAPIWNLSLEAHGFRVDEGAVRAAVARELVRADVPAGKEPVEIQVDVSRGGSLLVRYRNPEGAELTRSVATPSRADDVAEASALLVGNLARDEASALLAGLQQAARADAAAEAPPLPGASAGGPVTSGPVTSGPVPATPAPSAGHEAHEPPPILPLDSVNLSLFHPLTLRSATERRHLACELGMFYSRSAALSGLSLTLLGVTRVDGPASGVQLGGFGYWHGGPGAGLRLAGLFGASAGSFTGVSGAVLTTIHRGEHVGVELAALASIATGPVEGAQLGGILSYADSVSGVQASDIASLSRGPVEGAQLSVLTSVAGDVQGLQLSLVNIGGSIDGAQIGLVNVAGDVAGLQLGLVNVADSVKGQSLGLIPYNREGGLKIATWYNSNEPFNVGLRFHAGALYVMPTFAFDPSSAVLLTGSGARYSPGWSVGVRVPLDRAFVDLDANYSQRAQGWSSVADRIDLRYRALIGWQIMRGFAAFAGGGLRHHVITDNGPGQNSLAPELSVGMELL